MTGFLQSPGSGRRRFFLALALYFILHIIVRVCLSGNVELDEAEQVLLTQKADWGYGSQPPLYTWLQAICFILFGQGIFALALLKNLLLFSLYTFTFLAAREMSGEDRSAVAAAAALLFLPQIAWESQRDLTHSVLATAIAAACIYALVRLCKRGAKTDYLFFGLCIGLGMLSKYNFAVFLAALLLATLSLPQLRRRILCPNFLLALLTAGILTGGHLLWVLQNTGETLRQAGTFHREALPSIWLDYARGGGALLRASVSFAGPLVAIYFLIFFRRPSRQETFEALPYRKLLARLLVLGILLCLLLVLVFRVTNFKDRWMQPILFASTIYLALALRSRLDSGGLRRLLVVSTSVAALILILLPARLLFSGEQKRPAQLNAPFEEVARQLRETGFDDGIILAENRWLGGNLRLQFPDSNVHVPELPPPPQRENGDWLVVWVATVKPDMPAPLAELCRSFPQCPSTAPPIYMEIPYRHDHRRMRLGIIRFKG